MAAASGSKFTNVLRAKEDLQKSPQQLEQEKREALKSRIIPLELDGKSKGDMVQMAKKLHQILTNLHSQIYDLTERYERQKYDMVELTERARQIEKGKSKTRKSNVVHTGLGGSAFNWLADQYASAPPKVSLFSRYERVTDRRTFDERRDAFLEKAKKEPAENLTPAGERPKAKIRQVQEVKDEASESLQRRKSSIADRRRSSAMGSRAEDEEERNVGVASDRKESYAPSEPEEEEEEEEEEDEITRSEEED